MQICDGGLHGHRHRVAELPRLGLRMTNTGSFQILSFEMVGVSGADDELVHSVTARCHQCGHVTTITDGAIHHLAGGLVIQCEQCDNRQALPNAGLAPSRIDRRRVS